MLRFDGLYRSEAVQSGSIALREYIRFYQDGTVITQSVSEPATVAQIMAWFVRDRPATSQGLYFVDGEAIRFTTIMSFGMDRDGTTMPDIIFDYEGAVLPDRVVLRSRSLEGGEYPEREYVFAERE